jgi:hypothetical protein
MRIKKPDILYIFAQETLRYQCIFPSCRHISRKSHESALPNPPSPPIYLNPKTLLMAASCKHSLFSIR